MTQYQFHMAGRQRDGGSRAVAAPHRHQQPVIIAVGFGSFFAWAFIAPLDSAVPAAGTVVVNSKRKTISVLESGNPE